MARNYYNSQKRAKELKRQKKQEAKRQRKLVKQAAAESGVVSDGIDWSEDIPELR